MSAVPISQVGQGQLGEEEDEVSMLKKMKPHVPGIVTFADHSRPLPWSVTYHAVVMFADISGFTALCEKYSTDGQSGVDQLTITLNEYLSALVEGILGSDGDILKFAGDAILAIWRVGRIEELNNEIMKVVQCCLDIQEKCGEWNTDIGIKLTVKIGLSAGEMTVTFLGNQEYRHYVELGPAVTAVNAAENFCQSGMIVMSPDMFKYCSLDRFNTDILEDGQHRRVCSITPCQRKRSASLPIPLSLGTLATDGLQKSLSDKNYAAGSRLPPLISTQDVAGEEMNPNPVPFIITEMVEDSQVQAVKEQEVAPKLTLKSTLKSTMKIGNKFGKLRKVVETVTDMRLDIALRLYILSPVLKKLDDNQPLEYLSEMRQVTIVFMNLVLHDCDDSKDILQETFKIVYSKSKEMHGCLNKVFLFDKGCTFLVIFGLPGYKHENDCAHALLSSGRMKNQLENLDGIQRVSIGVTTGTTFCGVVGHPKRHEYSVIGRKVNMAARLMMHYPGKITCDTDTHQTSRLPPASFDVLITKRMKGLRNVGVIREFIGLTKDEKRVAKSITHSEYPMLGRQLDEYLFKLQIGNMQKRQHIIYNGPAGIGKSKLLDELITIAVDKNFRVISCRVDIEDSSYPFFVANHILRALLSNNGYSDQIDKEPHIMDALGELSDYLYLLNDVMGFEIKRPQLLINKEVNEKKKRKELMHLVSALCMESERETIIVIDDAHNVDTSSWEFLCELLPIPQALIVLSLRPSIIEVPTCPKASVFLEHKSVKLHDLGSLDLNFMAPLACQMIDVASIPKDLDKILRERSHGVPTWCMEILKDMLDKKQLIVVYDDGSPECQQPSVAPNKLLIKPRSSFTKAGRPSETSIVSVLKVDVTDIAREVKPGSENEMSLLTDLGFVHDSAADSYKDIHITSPKEIGAGYAFGPNLAVPQGKYDLSRDGNKKEKYHDRRIAIFAKGIVSKDIPVPASMKELINARLDSMRASDQLLVKCAAVLGKTVRRDILEMLLPKAHRPKLARTIRRLIESGIFQCGNAPPSKFKKAIKDEPGNQKYRCYCHKDDIQTRVGELESCFEPTFTNKLLQQTAYEILMESQRTELHTKAAHYFELSADEIKKDIPYYILCLLPEESMMAKWASVEVFEPRKTRRNRNRVSDEVFAKMAIESKARRGRRQAIMISAEDAVPLVLKIVEKARPMESIHHLLETLIPIYRSLISHLKHANNMQKVMQTVMEAIPALIFVQRNAEAIEMIEYAYSLLVDIKIQQEVDSELMLAKLHRLHGKVLYNSGRVDEAYTQIRKAASLLKLKLKQTSTRYAPKWMWKLKIYWRLRTSRTSRNQPMDGRSLEQGYCLHDLYIMAKDQEHPDAIFGIAMQHFATVVGKAVDLHQAVNAYSEMIECCRGKQLNQTAQTLELELLQSCATRHDELSSEDRSVLGKIYATSCIQFFLKGESSKADVSGNAAAEICISIRDRETIRSFAPYYCLLCLFRNRFPICVEMLKQLKYAAQLTDNHVAKTLYFALSLEVIMAGGVPIETRDSAFEGIAKQLKSCDAAANEMTSRCYAAMTSALCCAKDGRWSRMQLWFDYWEMYETDDSSFFGIMARINKIHSMLHSLSKCIEISNKTVATQLKPIISKDLRFTWKSVRTIKVLKLKVIELQACYDKLLKTRGNMKSSSRSDMYLTEETNFESDGVKRNIDSWLGKTHADLLNKMYVTDGDSMDGSVLYDLEDGTCTQ